MDTNTQLIDYSITDAAIGELHQKYDGLDARQDYEGVTKAIAACRKLRTSVEKKRKSLVADAVAWQKAVNTEAKRVTGLIAEVEDPLKISKQDVDDAAERARLEEERRKEEEAQRAREEEMRKLQEEREQMARERRELEEQRRQLEAEKEAAKPKPKPASEESTPVEDVPVVVSKVASPADLMPISEAMAIRSWMKQCQSSCPHGLTSSRGQHICGSLLEAIADHLKEVPQTQTQPVTI